MKRRVRTEVTVEIERVTIVRSSPASPALVWCRECACEVAMVTPDEAALARGCSVRALFREVEAGHLHIAESSDGLLRVCVNSLSSCGSNRRVRSPRPQAGSSPARKGEA